jgi:hypothetical protein
MFFLEKKAEARLAEPKNSFFSASPKIEAWPRSTREHQK